MEEYDAWCGDRSRSDEDPRQKHLPRFHELAGQGDPDAKSWRYRAEERVTWPNVFAGSTDAELCRAWGVDGFPTTFVLDENGVIRAKGARGAELEAIVDELVKELREKR